MVEIDFKKGEGLIPVIIQDAASNEVLMLGYMNKESWEKTLVFFNNCHSGSAAKNAVQMAKLLMN